MSGTDEHAALNEAITAARSAALPRAADVVTYRQYVLGQQAVTLSGDMKRALTGLLKETGGHQYVDNLCRLAVTTAADYLTLARLDIDAPDGAERDALESFIAATWAYNQVPELEARANVAAYRDGDHAIGLDWDARTMRPRLFNLRWWNGTAGVFVHYDDTGLADWAVNEWGETINGESVARRVVWYPDRIARYASRGAGGWEPLRLPGDGGWPQPWVDGQGQPIGIPVVHFACALIPNDEADLAGDETDSRYGLSLLSGGALGVQDALNDAHYDLIVAARRSAFPVYTATGVQLRPKVGGQPGETEPLDTTPGALLSSSSPDSRFGILTPGDMAQLFAVISGHTRVFARLTNTPMQIVNEEGTDAQSGVALLRMQLAAVRQARRSQMAWGPRWGSVFHKASALAVAFGKAELNLEVALVGAYDPVEASDVAVMAEVATLLTQAGLPLAETLRMLGRTPQDIERILADKQAEREAAGASFDRALNFDQTGG